jgi:hypothetical protein
MRLSIMSLLSSLCLLLGSTAAHSSDVSGPYSLQVVDEHGDPLRRFDRGGRAYTLGTLGQRYLLRVTNNSGARVEVVASVDGRDVLDGRTAEWSKRGYIVEPYGSVTIDGFRLSDASVAAFRFSSVPNSYAARMGDARDVGVVGVAVFSERRPPVVHHWHRAKSMYPSSSRRSDMPADDGNFEGLKADLAPAPRGGDALGGATSGEAGRSAQPERRPGLGTEFGEARESQVYRVEFQRGRQTPDAVLTTRYNDRRGLLSLGIEVDGPRHSSWPESWMRESADPFRRDSTYSQPPPGWHR